MKLDELIPQVSNLHTLKDPVKSGRSAAMRPVLLKRNGVEQVDDIYQFYPKKGTELVETLGVDGQPQGCLITVKVNGKKKDTWRNVDGLWMLQVSITQKVVFDFSSMIGALKIKTLGEENILNPSTAMRFGAGLVGLTLGVQNQTMRDDVIKFVELLMTKSDRVGFRDGVILLNINPEE